MRLTEAARFVVRDGTKFPCLEKLTLYWEEEVLLENMDSLKELDIKVGSGNTNQTANSEKFDVSIGKCNKLEKVTMKTPVQWERSGSDRNLSRDGSILNPLPTAVMLYDLPQLQHLSFGDSYHDSYGGEIFWGLSSLEIRRCSIKVLKIPIFQDYATPRTIFPHVRSVGSYPENIDDLFGLAICGNNFPALEVIVLDTCTYTGYGKRGTENPKEFILQKITHLHSLKEIFFNGNDHRRFVKSIEGIDLDEVKVTYFDEGSMSDSKTKGVYKYNRFDAYSGIRIFGKGVKTTSTLKEYMNRFF